MVKVRDISDDIHNRNLETSRNGFWRKTITEEIIMSNTVSGYGAATEAAAAAAADYTSTAAEKKEVSGKTIGNPKLSEKAARYYEQLKKKFSNMDFILVSEDQKEAAKAQAASYANASRMVVLIDEAKIERMAEDEAYRKQYEGVISGAGSKLLQMKSSLTASGAQVKGYGMQVNDGGLTSFFAVLKKSSADQKTRINKQKEKTKSEKKAAEKKAEKKQKEEKLKESRTDKASGDEEETVIISASSLEELLQKIDDYSQNERMYSMQSEEEKQIGQHIDFRG